MSENSLATVRVNVFSISHAVLVQGIAVVSFIYTCIYYWVNPNPKFTLFEIIELQVWLGASGIGSVANMQKLKYLQSMKKSDEKNRVCNFCF